MDDGIGAIKSYMGCFCTLFWVGIIMLYAMQKIDILINKKGVNVLATIKDLHFDDNEEFDYYKNSFNVAVAFTGYDNSYEWSLDARYGQLVVNAFEWGYDEDGDPFTERKPLKTHKCTREELHLEDSADSQFFHIHGSSKRSMERYWQKFLCIDPPERRIAGSYDSESARQLNIQLKRCQGPDCAGEKEIEDYFKNKFILVMTNEARFVTDGFGNNRVAQEARIHWLVINSKQPHTHRYQITQT